MFHRAELVDLLASNDPAFRAAAYRHARIEPVELTAAAERDGALVDNEALDNRLIWRTAEGREVLEALEWANKHNDDLSSVNRYKGLNDYYLKTQPEWFKEEEKSAAAPSKYTSHSSPTFRMQNASSLSPSKEYELSGMFRALKKLASSRVVRPICFLQTAAALNERLL